MARVSMPEPVSTGLRRFQDRHGGNEKFPGLFRRRIRVFAPGWNQRSLARLDKGNVDQEVTMAAPYQGTAGNEPQDAQKPRRTHRRRTSYLLTEEDEFLLKELPERQAEMLRQEGSLEEISARLQLPLGTVKSRTHRARAALDALRARSRDTTAQ